MGCASSSWRDVPHEQLSGNLSARQIQLIRDTWDIISDDLEGTGYLIFRRLFQTERDIKALFINLMSSDQSAPGDEVELDDYLVKKHAHVVMETLGAAVECLEDSAFLSNVLVALGQIHASYKVQPHILSRVWPSVRFGLSQVLQDDFTEDVEETWHMVFNYIIGRMREGIRLELSQTTARMPGASPIHDDTSW